MSEGDKKEIINYMLAKVFCVSQKVDSKHHLAREYLQMVEMLCEDVADRNLLIISIESIFKSKQNLAMQPFDNLVRVTRAIFDSYLPKSEATWYSSATFDFTDFERLRNMTRQFHKQE